MIFRTIHSLYVSMISALAMPIALLFIIAGKLASYCNAFPEVSLLASMIPFLFGQRVRYYYYKMTLDHLGKDVVFKYGSFCQYNTARIGDRVMFGYYNAIGEVNMGNDIVVGGFVNFISGTNQHSFDDPNQTIRAQQAIGRSTITIGSDVWIGSNAIITANIGDRCVIGAGAVLVKPAESKTVYAGNPAKWIKNIPAE